MGFKTQRTAPHDQQRYKWFNQTFCIDFCVVFKHGIDCVINLQFYNRNIDPNQPQTLDFIGFLHYTYKFLRHLLHLLLVPLLLVIFFSSSSSSSSSSSGDGDGGDGDGVVVAAATAFFFVFVFV